ncbi:MAG: hypothetical protein K2I80_00510 [Ruminococcus sp.]|nr:hypothetical protein [Ruminococcus sp.]MDE6847812.1 hypothetical protein [Ruminococcus sp.]
MNCYAYALQTYYTGNEYYQLYPGEIGIGKSYSDSYTASNWKDLKSYYGIMGNVIENNARLHQSDDLNYNMVKYLEFVENQMRRDAIVMNNTIVKYNSITNVAGSVIKGYLPNVNESYNVFIPPDDYDENNKRFIAMIGYVSGNNAFDEYTASMHYYVRNGNGTCGNPSHRGTCSIWSHKMGNNPVSIYNGNTILCDYTLYDNAYKFSRGNNISIYANTDLVNFYSITKDTNVYNSSFGYEHNDNSTGTQYFAS